MSSLKGTEQIIRDTHDDASNATRVVIVGGANSFSSTHEIVEKQVVVKELVPVNVPTIVKEVQIVEVPTIVKEVSIKEIEKQIVVKETQVLRVEVPVIVKQIEIVEKTMVGITPRTIPSKSSGSQLLMFFSKNHQNPIF